MNLELFKEKLESAESEKIDIDYFNNVLKESINKGKIKDLNLLREGHINLIIVMEELSELSKEISKHLRGKDNRYEILEEYADVTIGLLYLQILMGFSEDEITKAVKIKIDRLNDRLQRDDIINHKGGYIL